MTKPIPQSSQIVLDAVVAHMAATDESQKAISINAGFDRANYLSMLKAGARVAFARIPGLKHAMPELDDVSLVAAVFSESFPEKGAQEALLTLFDYLAQPQSFEASLLSIVKEIRDEDEAAGLSIPVEIPASTRLAIKALLKAAVQRETIDEHDL